MSEILPVVYLARHGETAWSATGQHTGLTDLPLTKRGERNALRLRKRLAGFVFAEVFTSPLQRAVRTCELAGFGAVAQRDHDLVEWNYGDYEGLSNVGDSCEAADWQLFRGRLPQRGIARADRCASRSCCQSDTRDQRRRANFFQRTFLRVFTARWLGLEPFVGKSHVRAERAKRLPRPHKKFPDEWFETEPAGGEHSQECPLEKISTSPLIARIRLTTRSARAPICSGDSRWGNRRETTAIGPLRTNLRRSKTFVIAIVPFDQIVIRVVLLRRIRPVHRSERRAATDS